MKINNVSTVSLEEVTAEDLARIEKTGAACSVKDGRFDQTTNKFTFSVRVTLFESCLTEDEKDILPASDEQRRVATKVLKAIGLFDDTEGPAA